MRNQQVYPKINELDGCYELITGYDAGFVAELKAMIPASARRFDSIQKSWVIDAQYGMGAAMLINRYFGIMPDLPPILSQTPDVSIDILKILYIGQCKKRRDGSSTALGYMDPGGWSVSFPESVLRDWFCEGPKEPQGNLFTILGLKPGASDDDIRVGYRRMAKQWHPDLCREPNADAVFHRIQDAYDKLRDIKTRKRYEAGLIFEATLGQPPDTEQKTQNYRTPLRNGLILCQYERGVGLMTVTAIKSWADIMDSSSRTLVSSWVMGEKSPRMEWA